MHALDRRSLVILLLCSIYSSISIADDSTLTGYTPASSTAERGWEAKLRALPQPERMRAAMRRLAAHPHHVGAKWDEDNARWIQSELQAAGWDARIESYEVLFPTPKERVVELVAPTKFRAKLVEPPVAGDPTSAQQDEQLPVYNAFSPDGDVTAKLVYVNDGTVEDYERLERLGVSAKGAIVIVRYGGEWRGLKPKLAAEHGAVGCLIYSDPEEDGYADGDAYPKGPMRPADGAQRGSVLDMTQWPGDPLTPDVAATPSARRLPVDKSPIIPKIPVLPLSWGDAQPLLAALEGPMAPPEWRGALAQPYHVGAGPAEVHLRVRSDWSRKIIRDVIARLPGSTLADEWVLRGNHHDAWVNGASDPVSGQVAMLEEARVLGALYQQGWRPQRTIVYCAWDGEEPLLFGSTEWSEQHAAELKQHAVLYLNSDSNDRGFLWSEGSPLLEKLVHGVAGDVEDPESHQTVLRRQLLRAIAQADSPDEKQRLRRAGSVHLRAPGSGSDYAPFVHHLGIATLNLGFGGEAPSGSYHSIYDDDTAFEKFRDGEFVYGRALAQLAGTIVMRVADADLLPFDLGGVAEGARRLFDDLQRFAERKRDQVVERNAEIAEGLFVAMRDPRQPQVAPAVEEVPPRVDLVPLENALDALDKSVEKLDASWKRAPDRGASLDARKRRALDALLAEAERRLTTPEGLPRRPWYRHVLYAAGAWTGYAAKTLPGVREAIEQKRWAEADSEARRAARAILDEARLVDAIAALLDKR